MSRRRVRRPLLALLVLLAVLVIGYAVRATRGHRPGPAHPASQSPSSTLSLSQGAARAGGWWPAGPWAAAG